MTGGAMKAVAKPIVKSSTKATARAVTKNTAKNQAKLYGKAVGKQMVNSATTEIADGLSDIVIEESLNFAAQYCDSELLNNGIRVAKAMLAVKSFAKASKTGGKVTKTNTTLLGLRIVKAGISPDHF